MFREELFHIAGQITNAQSISEEISAGKALAVLLTGVSLQPDVSQRQEDTLLSGGFAISPEGAALCLDEYVRTVRFLKGVWSAITELKQRFPGEKINLLYAGCGPFGAIVLPVLPLFSPDEIGVTLLDIHAYSIASVTKLATDLGLSSYIKEAVLGDAITYTYPAGIPLHIVVTETMLHALVREPQVAVTANLAPQITKNGLLIPEEISVDLGYTFFVYEPWIDPAYQEVPAVKPGHPGERIMNGTLFSLNKDRNFSELYKSSGKFESGICQVPSSFENTPDICLFTSVRIYGEIRLGAGESTITNPYCVKSFYNLGGSRSFKLNYHFHEAPDWDVETVDHL